MYDFLTAKPAKPAKATRTTVGRKPTSVKAERSQPSKPNARLRAENQIVEFDPDDSLSLSEVGAFPVHFIITTRTHSGSQPH